MFNKPLSVSLVVFRHHVIKEVLNSSLLTKTLSKDLRKVLTTKSNRILQRGLIPLFGLIEVKFGDVIINLINYL